jgi:hypothetical protein
MSAKTVAEKLRINSNTALWSSHADRVALIEPLPDGTRLVSRPHEATAVLVFGDDEASLRRIVASPSDAVRDAVLLWVAYPKGNRTDINRDTLWPILAEHGLRPVAQVALDDTWSALRFRVAKCGEKFPGGARA